MVARILVDLSDLSLQEQNTKAVLVHVEGKIRADNPVITCALARQLGEWSEGRIHGERVTPSNEIERRDFKILSAIGLLNEYAGEYDISGVAQRSVYEFV